MSKTPKSLMSIESRCDIVDDDVECWRALDEEQLSEANMTGEG
jgi:hypothetical protein